MLNWLGKLFTNTDRVELPQIYSLEIPNSNMHITNSDMDMLKHFINFYPSKENLRCRIQRHDKHIGFVENIEVYIYCESSSKEWNSLGRNMLSILDFISFEKRDDVNSFNDFMHLIEFDEDESHTIDADKIRYQTSLFLNDIKLSFQSPCKVTDNIFFEIGSNINDFKLVWGNQSCMNFIVQSQG